MNQKRTHQGLYLLVFALLPLILLLACTPSGGPGTEERFEETFPPATETPDDVTDEDGNTPEPPSADLSNINWTLLHTIVGGDAVVPPPDGSYIFFEITSEGVSGSAGCNRFNGDVTIEGDRISFGPLAATRRACAEAIMSYENAVLDVLSQTATYTVADGTLILSTANGLPLAEFVAAQEKTLFVGPELAECVGVGPQECLLVRENVDDSDTFFYDSIVGFDWEPGFEYELRVSVSQVPEPLPADSSAQRYQLIEVVSKTAVAPNDDDTSTDDQTSGSESATAPQLTGTVWQWVRFEDGSGHNGIEVETPSRYTIEFTADGTYLLQNDCNSGSGPYTIDGSSIRIEPGITTLAECGEGSLDQTFSQRLSEVVTFVLADGQLFLNLQMDGGNLVFEPAQ